jgi:hypothetical protein
MSDLSLFDIQDMWAENKDTEADGFDFDTVRHWYQENGHHPSVAASFDDLQSLIGEE